MVDVNEVQSRVVGHSIVSAVDVVAKGHVRVETAFLYPEGSSVDLYLPAEQSHLPQLRLTDMGRTMEWLLDVQVRPWLSKKRQGFVEDALRIYGVRQEGGAIELSLASLDEIVPGIVRLGQACVRVADLIYTRRTSLQAPATEEIEEVIAEGNLQYEPNAELEGRFGNLVRVDFLVHGRKTDSAVLAWSSANSSAAHVQANEIFRRWYDLDVPTRKEQRTTIFDDRFDVYREEDLKRLRDKSDVVGLSDRTAIMDLLAA